MIAHVLLIPVGVVFLFTGLVKVNYSRPFIIHVRNLGLMPRSLNEIAASLFIQLECGVGAALLLFAFPVELIPVLIAVILALSVLTAWGMTTGRVDDCGCYGGWLNLSLKQSLGLNLIYVILLVAAWITLDRDPLVPMWKVLTLIGIMAFGNFTVRGSANLPLVDLSPLKPGRRWQPGWLELSEFSDKGERSVLAVFMSGQCYQCKDWDPYILNLKMQPDLPDPVLIFPKSDKAAEERLAGVPHLVVRPGLFRYLVYQTPTAVLVRDNRIEDRWIGRFPEEYV